MSSGESPAPIQQFWNSPYWDGVAHIAGAVLFGGFATVLLVRGFVHVFEYSVSHDLSAEMLIAGGMFGIFLLMGILAGLILTFGGIYVGSRTIIMEVNPDVE